MPRRSGKPFNLYLSPEEKESLERLAEQLGRSLHDELRHAVARHLAAPPVLCVPAMPPAGAEPQPKMKRGRKPKKG